ncbi:MAG TPA: hypothetical protein PK085_03695 [bacterium]|nr:hypothetical protein [bacterium]
MFIIIVLIIVIIFSVVIFGYLLFKRLPDLRSLDIESIAEEKEGKARAKILEAKFSRTTGAVSQKLNHFVGPSKNFFRAKFRHLKDSIYQLEETYKSDHAKKKKRPPTINELFVQAKGFIDKDEFAPAEKALIEIISRDNKNVPAYEMLGDLYFDNRSYDQAEEIYKYLLKLYTVKNKKSSQALNVINLSSDELQQLETALVADLDIDPKIATYYDDLGEVYDITGKIDKGLEAYLKATAIEPSNPKYLNRLIDFAIKAGDKGLAKKTFKRLRQINPENAKLGELESAIEKMK